MWKILEHNIECSAGGPIGRSEGTFRIVSQNLFPTPDFASLVSTLPMKGREVWGHTATNPALYRFQFAT